MNNLVKDMLFGLQPAHLGSMILLILLAGCDHQRMPSDVRKSLNLAGGNKKELLEVIHHYKQTDHEKLQAAYYLISNMPGHYSIGGQGIFDPVFDKIMPLLKESGATSDNGAVFTNLIDSIRFNSRTTFTAEPDIMFIDAGYLIENIDLAFQAYSKIPEHLKYNQEIFMRFVLPYRNLNEPIEAGLRRYFFTRYHWVFDRMHQYGSMHQAACDLLDSLNISFHHLYRYPFVMPLSNCYRIRLGNSCDSMVNLAVFIFRSLGIPVAYDYTPIWPVGAGNLGKGHAWLAFLLNDTVYGIDIPDKKMMNRLYKHEVLPKIYRRTYEKNQISSFFPNSLDVTNQYRNTVNVPVNQRENTGKSLLNVFNSVRGWVSIDESVNQRGNHYFGTIAL